MDEKDMDMKERDREEIGEESILDTFAGFVEGDETYFMPGQVSDMLQITPEALRKWSELLEDLLHLQKGRERKHRRYSVQAIEIIETCENLRKTRGYTYHDAVDFIRVNAEEYGLRIDKDGNMALRTPEDALREILDEYSELQAKKMSEKITEALEQQKQLLLEDISKKEALEEERNAEMKMLRESMEEMRKQLEELASQKQENVELRKKVEELEAKKNKGFWGFLGGR